MTIRLPFINHIKVLLQIYTEDNDVTLNKPRSYEVEILPTSTQSGGKQIPLSSEHTIKTEATVAAPRVSTRASRLWSANQESSWCVEHTRSNLG